MDSLDGHYFREARGVKLDVFAARYGCPFLVGEPEPEPEAKTAPTRRGHTTKVIEPPSDGVPELPPADRRSWHTAPFEIASGGDATEPLALPVRKLKHGFESMVTVGRTANNDITLPHSSISKFHAYFRKEGDRLVLHDAGSRNGTWVGTTKLAPKGAPAEVAPGHVVRFGAVRLRLLTAEQLWHLAQLGR